jgi:hypothetical protein
MVRIALAAFLAFLTGCATLFAPGPDPIPVYSEPAGARVYLDGRPMGATPTIVMVNRKDAGILRIELPGYEPLVLDIDKEFNPPTLLNVFLLGGMVIGFAVDAATQNLGRYPEEPVFVRLVARYDDGREVTFDRPLELARGP